MKHTFHSHLLARYLVHAPLALALERWFECQLLSRYEFEGPVLDLGCGDGIFASVLFREPLELGIDLDPAETAKAQQLGCYGQVITCPGDRIPMPDASFPTILSNSVLEHIPDLGPVLDEARRLLAQGGRFYVTVPSDRFDHCSAGSRLLEGLGMREAAAAFRRGYNRFWKHYHYYPPEGWRALFERHGFRVLDEARYNSPRATLANDLMVPLAVPAKICKMVTGRWFWLPALRGQVAGAMARLVSRLYGPDPRHPEGSLLFFCLG